MLKTAILSMLLCLVQPATTIEEPLKVTNNGELMTTINRVDVAIPYVGETVIDTEKLDMLLEDVDNQIYQEPKNAMIDGQGRIVPAQVGYKLNREALTKQIYSYFYGSAPLTIEVPRQQIYAKVDSELLANIRVKMIGHFVTYFNSYNKERTHNIRLAADAINNHVIFPGETFSFNRVVGKRTVQKGYMKAPVIIRGELSEGIGGGICQVSSTLFNAVDRAGVKILERYTHSRRVPYVRPGRDATVSWYGPDFTFKNDYNQPLLIRTITRGGQLYVMLFSSDLINYEPRNI